MNGLVLALGAGVLFWMWYQSQGASGGSLPSDAVFMTTIPVGTAVTVPASFTQAAGLPAGPATSAIAYLYFGAAEGLFYTSFTAPTQSQCPSGSPVLSGSGGMFACGAAGTSTTAPVGAPVNTSGSSEVPPAPTPSSGATSGTSAQPSTYQGPGGATMQTPTNLAGLWNAILSWVATDPNFTGSGTSISGTGFHWMTYLTAIWPNDPSGYGGAWPPDWNAVFPGVDESQPMTASTFWNGMMAYLQQGGLSGLRGMGGLGAVNAFAVRGPGGWAA